MTCTVREQRSIIDANAGELGLAPWRKGDRDCSAHWGSDFARMCRRWAVDRKFVLPEKI